MKELTIKHTYQTITAFFKQADYQYKEAAQVIKVHWQLQKEASASQTSIYSHNPDRRKKGSPKVNDMLVKN